MLVKGICNRINAYDDWHSLDLPIILLSVCFRFGIKDSKSNKAIRLYSVHIARIQSRDHFDKRFSVWRKVEKNELIFVLDKIESMIENWQMCTKPEASQSMASWCFVSRAVFLGVRLLIGFLWFSYFNTRKIPRNAINTCSKTLQNLFYE